jgi:trans-2,3-dihydro-3-hydroxyanthranilate isomerase
MFPTFYIVDVFAENKFAGNQLAVVLGAANLSGLEMQSIAAEMNYSETTFVLSEEERSGGYDIQIFTPKEEIPFAGHPTLGTAYVIAREIKMKPTEHIILNLKIGQLPVSIGEVCWLSQPSPTFGDTFTASRLSRVLGLEDGDLDEQFPIQEVSTGASMHRNAAKEPAGPKKMQSATR